MQTGAPMLREVRAASHWRSVDFISDLHLHPEDPDTAQAWQDYLTSTPADAVFILGDLFEVWPGDDCLGTPADAATEPASAQARSSSAMSAGVSGEASRQASSWPAKAKVCST